MSSVAALAITGCLAVAAGSDQILLRDFAPVFPAVDAALGDTAVAFAPAPGVRRVFRLPELRQLAGRFHLEIAGENEICFERRVTPLEPARLQAAMRKTLPEAQIEVLDFPARRRLKANWNSGLRGSPAARTEHCGKDPCATRAIDVSPFGHGWPCG